MVVCLRGLLQETTEGRIGLTVLLTFCYKKEVVANAGKLWRMREFKGLSSISFLFKSSTKWGFPQLFKFFSILLQLLVFF
jgi:hypothetical protein